MNLRRWWDTTFAVEVMLLGLAAPILYFPARFPQPALFLAMGLLALGWMWRRWRLGYWFQRTPADWPIFFLFFVMLPVAVWVAPQPLRAEYSWPKTYVLIWNFCLFWTVVTHAGRRRALRNLCAVGFAVGGTAIAAISLLGTNWQGKLPGLFPILMRIPRVFAGAFEGAEQGFNPNQVGGTLLYVLPFLVAVTICEFWWRRRWHVLVPAVLSTAWIGLIFVAVQSRSALLGLAVSLVFMVLFNWRWGRWLIGTGMLIVVIGLPVLPWDSLFGNGDTAAVESTVGIINLAGRQEIWSRALYGIADFPLTGIGVGTFRKIVLVLYPLFLVPSSTDIGHAHNFFLQTALDFGLPGLIALLAVYLLAVVALVRRWQRATCPTSQCWAIGLLGALLAQSIYSLADSVAMGAKTNLMLWVLLALIFAAEAPAHNKVPKFP